MGRAPIVQPRGIGFWGELTDRGRSVKKEEHVNRAIRASTYPLGTLTGADNSAGSGSGALFRARNPDASNPSDVSLDFRPERVGVRIEGLSMLPT